MTDKFCKDCKGFHPGITKFDAPWCDRVPSVYDFVTGTSKSAFCCNARLSFWACGPEGRFWAAREKALNETDPRI